MRVSAAARRRFAPGHPDLCGFLDSSQPLFCLCKKRYDTGIGPVANLNGVVGRSVMICVEESGWFPHPDGRPAETGKSRRQENEHR